VPKAPAVLFKGVATEADNVGSRALRRAGRRNSHISPSKRKAVAHFVESFAELATRVNVGGRRYLTLADLPDGCQVYLGTSPSL
jgi:hypothetical protein